MNEGTQHRSDRGLGGTAPDPPGIRAGRAREPGERLERLHAYFLEGCPEEVRPALQTVLVRARLLRDGCGDHDVGDDLASAWYASAAVVELASALELDEADVRGAAAAVAEACALPLPAARIVLYGQSAGNPRLLELPPLLAAEIQLGLLLGLDVFSEVTLWRRTAGGLECLLTVGGVGEPSRRVRAEAKAVLRGRSRLSLLGGSTLRSTRRHRASASPSQPSSGASAASSRRSRTPSSRKPPAR